jgi:hypothetical protein
MASACGGLRGIRDLRLLSLARSFRGFRALRRIRTAAIRGEPAQCGLQLPQPFEILFENGVRLHAVLQTSKVCVEFWRTLFRKPIDHPIRAFRGFHESLPLQVAEMLGNLDLRFVEQALKMADAELISAPQEVQNAETGLVTEALVDDDQFRGFTRSSSASGLHA